MSNPQSPCRSCGEALEVYCDLGNLSLTGFFPNPGIDIPRYPLALAKCSSCGLSQLYHQIPVDQLYGEEYGYESHLNSQMQGHLIYAARSFERKFELSDGDCVLDIASNDGTLLSGYISNKLVKVGIDPLALSLNDKYPEHAMKIAQFFSAKAVREVTSNRFKVVTSFSVFYDLERPSEFINSIEELLTEDGVWILEQSYFYSMVETLSFDTICHEHLLYLRLGDIDKLLDKTSLEVFDVQLNDANGGSFRVFVKRKLSPRPVSLYVDWLRQRELSWENEPIYSTSVFNSRVNLFRDSLRDLLFLFEKEGKTIIGFGASTKGNALLQFCDLDHSVIEFIVEVNERKFGKLTPGTQIPIQNEEYFRELFGRHDDFVGLILPWHLAESIIERMSGVTNRSLAKKIVLPLPRYPKVFEVS